MKITELWKHLHWTSRISVDDAKCHSSGLDQITCRCLSLVFQMHWVFTQDPRNDLESTSHGCCISSLPLFKKINKFIIKLVSHIRLLIPGSVILDISTQTGRVPHTVTQCYTCSEACFSANDFIFFNWEIVETTAWFSFGAYCLANWLEVSHKEFLSRSLSVGR